MLVSEGRLQRADDAASWTVTIPQSVREVVGRRLDRLSVQCNAVLTTAAVVGREFGLDALERLTQFDGDALLALVEEAEAARLVDEVAGERAVVGRYAFAHALIRETLYGELSTTRRVRLHKQIGETLEALYSGNVEPHLGELAYHFGEAAAAGDVEKAIDYARQAGDRAVELYAWEEAAGHYERALQALELLPAHNERQQLDLLLALGDALFGGGDREGYRGAFARAAGVARRIGDADALARAALGFASPFNTAGVPDPQLVGLLEEALDLLVPGDSALRAMVTTRLGHALLFGDQRERMIALEQEALNMARRTGDKAAITYALGIIINLAVADPCSQDEQLSGLIDEAFRLAEESGNKRAMLHSLGSRVAVSLARGERDIADAAIELEGQLSAELRIRQRSHYPSLQARLDGRLDDVEALAQQWFVEARRFYPGVVPLLFSAQMLDLRRAQGRLGEIEGAFQRLADQAAPITRAMLALVYQEQDRREEARAVFDELPADAFSSLPDDGARPFLLEMLAEICCYLNDRPRAAVLYELLLPLARYCIVFGVATGSTGSASAPLGALAAVLGRFDDAERHFEDAIAMNRKLRAPTWVAVAQLGYARMLLARASPGDRERALELLQLALDAGQRMGMRKLVEDCLALKAQAQDIDRRSI